MSITLSIIIITCAASIPAFSSEKLKDDLVFWPYMMQRGGQLYRFISHGVLHADFMHLLFNMVSFYSFGIALEDYLFPALFGDTSRALLAILYLSAIVFAVIPDYFKYRHQTNYRSLGASGAVSAVVFSAITIQPSMPIQFIFIPFPIPGYIFGLGFLLLSAVLAKKGGGNIGHNAHFWGGVYGILFTYIAGRAISGIDLLRNFLNHVL